VQEFIAHVSSRDVSEVSERDRRSIFAWINTCLDPSTPYLDRTNAVVYQQGQVIDFTRESKFLPLGILSKQVSIVWNYSDYAVTCSLNVALDHIDELWLPGTEDVFIISIADHWLLFAQYLANSKPVPVQCVSIEQDSPITEQRKAELEHLSHTNMLKALPPFRSVTLTKRSDIVWISLSYPWPHQRLDLRESIIHNAELCHIRLLGAFFDGAQLRNTDFRFAMLATASFSHCILDNCNFSAANLIRAHFDNATIRNTHFAQAKVRDTVWMDAKIDENC